MSTLFLRTPLTPLEIKLLKEEFPQFTIHLGEKDSPLTSEEWNEIEIIYGEILTEEEVGKAHRLRWIHVPSDNHDKLCLDTIHKATNLLVTDTRNTDVHQVAEFVIGAILASAKEIFYWHEKQGNPGAIKESPHRDLIWALQGRTLLQIGLGRHGSAIADYSSRLGLRIWGIGSQKTFHPHCHKTFHSGELNALLPSVDIICYAPKKGDFTIGLKEDHFALMRSGGILILLSLEGVDEKALLKATQEGRFRHVVIDAPLTLSSKSPLWQEKAVTITPNIATCPKTETRLEFHQFQYNFRRYIHADYERMKNHV